MLFDRQYEIFKGIQTFFNGLVPDDNNKEFIVDKKTNKKKERIDKQAMYYMIAGNLPWYGGQKQIFENFLINNKNVLPYIPMSDEEYLKYDMHNNYYRGKYEYNKKIYESFNELKKENNLEENNSYEYKKDITKKDKYRCKYCNEYEEFTGYYLTPLLSRQQELIKHVFEKHPKEDLPRFGYFEYLIFDRFTQPIWSPGQITEKDKAGDPMTNGVSLINEYLKNNNVLILKSKTGTGKSVITPGLLLDCGFNQTKEYEYEDIKENKSEDYHDKMKNNKNILVIQESDDNEYTCPLCDKIKDVSKKQLKNHLKIKHKNMELLFDYNKQIVCTQPRQLNAEVLVVMLKNY